MLIIEDGTNVANSNSYVSLDDAKAYFSVYSFDYSSTTTDDALTQALIFAAKAMDDYFGNKYIFHLAPMSTQTMLWPRVCYYGEFPYDNNGRYIQPATIPVYVKNAQCEMALLVLNGEDLYPQENPDSQMIEEQFVYKDFHQRKFYQTATEVSPFIKAERILRPVLQSNTNWSISR